MLLELNDVRRYFGGVRAVDGVSGSLEEGRILGLIGPNGSGKTTLLSVIGRAMAQTIGEVLFGGRSMRGWSPQDAARAGIARVFQVPQPIVDLTVLENVAVGAMYGSRRLSRRDAEPEARQALEEVGLSAVATRYPRTLSLAERKTLELARLLAMRPRLALVDEVMGGLSPEQIKATDGVLRHLRDRGATLIVVEHVPGVVASIADEICVLHEGRVLRWGTPQEVISDTSVIDAYLGRRKVTHA